MLGCDYFSAYRKYMRLDDIIAIVVDQQAVARPSGGDVPKVLEMTVPVHKGHFSQGDAGGGR